MVNLLEETHERVVATKVSGKLDMEDYKQLFPLIKETIDQYGKFRWYIELEDFQGWNWQSIWQEIKMDIQHFSDLEKLAIVGDKDWEERILEALKHVSRAEVKYFPILEKKIARSWIEI